MATPDMEVIKEIPGYKVILKAIIKSQIQQLVEQLASHTDEESVLLTASVSDGTLCHLGSDSGKFFLEDHEDIKSQFLGFCLKRHHKRKQDKEKEEAAQSMAASPGYGFARPGFQQRTPRMMGPRHARGHGPRPRHSPYPMGRPPKRPVPGYDPQSGSPAVGPPVNLQGDNQESVETGANDSNSGAMTPSSEASSLAQIKKEVTSQEEDGLTSDENKSSEQSFSNTGPPEGLGLDSDFSNLISSEHTNTSQSVTDTAQASTSGEGTDTPVDVKLEADTEGDDLQITGVEPGEFMSQIGAQDSSWAQNVEGGMNYDPTGGAESQGDLSGADQSYIMLDASLTSGFGLAKGYGAQGYAGNRMGSQTRMSVEEQKLRHRELSKMRMRRYRERLKQRKAQLFGYSDFMDSLE